MRKILHQMLPLVPCAIAHPHALELQMVSDLLDRLPEATNLVFADLTRAGKRLDVGRAGLTAEQTLRALLIKQMNGYSYEELEFHLADSATFRAFCRLPLDMFPSKSTLQRNIKLVRAESVEKINRLLLAQGVEERIEKGRKVRIDATVTETNIHEPSDNSLLWDCVRVLVRLMGRGYEVVNIPFTSHRKAAKRRMLEAQNAKSVPARKQAYRALLTLTGNTVSYADQFVSGLAAAAFHGPETTKTAALHAELKHYVELTHRVMSQTERRVLRDEHVPAAEKVVSIFESHTDIIVKDRRDTHFGHKVTLTGGASGLITDCVIEAGNPADSALAVRMIDRQIEIYGRAPRQAAFDGGFAAKDNLTEIKGRGVKDVAFSKRRGIEILDMVKSTWVYRRLRDFRAGIEGMISFLKRGFGLRRVTWRGLSSFKAYVWSSILSANLLVFARHKLA